MSGQFADVFSPAIVGEESSPRFVTIRGEVVNASGNSLPKGLSVSLRVFDDMSPVYIMTTVVDEPSGAFSFDAVEVRSGRSFVVSTRYMGHLYTSRVIHASDFADTTEIFIQLYIYEPTSNSAHLLAERVHVFFDLIAPQMLRVTEFLIISNVSPYVFTSANAGEPAIYFALPPRFVDLEVEDSQNNQVMVTEDGFGTLSPIFPGQLPQEILFSYNLPYDDNLEMNLKFPVAVSSIVVALPQDNMRLTSKQLSDAGWRDVRGRRLRLYETHNLAAEDALYVSLSRRVGVFLPSDSSLGTVIGGVVFALAAFFSWRLLWRKGQCTSKKAEHDGGVVSEDREAVLDAIIALDDLFRAGELPEEVYRRRRSDLKEKLKSG
ncbi:MAG: hypothetical protein HPY45_12115 [Anaerolineae bacterium]|nr:hypothetical protein [Anaerolineae bacterium]